MKEKRVWLIPIAAFLLAGAGLLSATDTANSWQSGRVISSGLSGHGPSKEPTGKRIPKVDIWWNYCISAERHSYSVLSREKPAKIGLTNNRLIKFSERKNQILIISPAGRQISLRILSKSNTAVCP